MSEHTPVSHDLYQNDQFCGLAGSSGPSQVTKFGSVLGWGRKGNTSTTGSFSEGSCGLTSTLTSTRASPDSFSDLVVNSWVSKTVDVEECSVWEELALIVVSDEIE